jgi:hypothetical protein
MFNFAKRRTIRDNEQPEAELIAIFDEVRQHLARKENDFSYSRWSNSTSATAEVNALIHQLRNHHRPEALQLELIFAPSGPLQEMSLQCGWEDAFFQLADRFDRAIHAYKILQDQPRNLLWSGALEPA